MEKDSYSLKYTKILTKACPSEVEYLSPTDWAIQVEINLIEIYKLDSHPGKRIQGHIKSLISNLKTNGSYLSTFKVSDLIRLTPTEMISNTNLGQKRLSSSVGLDCWEESVSKDVMMTLSKNSFWNQRQSLELVLISFYDKVQFNSLKETFKSIPRVFIEDGNILSQDGNGHKVDTFVSPANTIGNMDGGIDKVFADHFDWSYGRPYQSANPLQKVIDQLYGEGNELPIGKSVIVSIGRHSFSSSSTHSVKYLIASPTMIRPGPIEVGSRVVFNACKAVFHIWRDSIENHSNYVDVIIDNNTINRVAMPMFGTGYGDVPAIVAAKQMAEAFVSVMGKEIDNYSNDNYSDDNSNNNNTDSSSNNNNTDNNNYDKSNSDNSNDNNAFNIKKSKTQ